MEFNGQEIGYLIGVPINTVKSLIHLVISSLSAYKVNFVSISLMFGQIWCKRV